ncbi:MAG: hypothetical protein WD078_04220 [Woeseia sp.]
MLKLKSCYFALLLAAAAAAPAVYAADVDGYPGFDTSTDRGLYVWRTPDGGWQVRLLAGGDWRSFEGTFETSGSVWGVTPVSLESGDAVTKPSSGKVGVKFNAQNLDVDGAAFDLAAGADLCLRGQSGTTTAYLGSNAVPVSLPASLSGSNACSTAGGTTGDGAGDGLFVSRGSNGVWELTLFSESNPAAFSGTFEATQSINWLRRESFESDDSAWKSDNKTATMNMSAWPGGYDGLDISIPDGAGACLRDATGGKSTVYLGSSLADAVAVTTPVDLTNSGACGGTSDGGDQKVADGRKFNPGHYIALMRGNDSQATMAASITSGVKGFLKRYTWRELEPSEGQYDFSEMKSDLDFAASQGMHLIVMVEDKTFVNEMPTPSYLSWYTRKNRAGGYTVARWAPKVVTRHKALLSAIGARFDGNAYFEGVATQETAPSLSNAELDATGYTPEKFRDALIDILSHGARELPKSRMFFFMNYLPRQQSYIGDVASAVASKGVVMGGPDVMPDEHSLQEHTYPFYREFAGKMPLFGQVEPICYHHQHADKTKSTKYWTPGELFRYARDNLDVNYMFWVNYPRALYWDSYDYYDTLPVIGNNPQFNQ